VRPLEHGGNPLSGTVSCPTSKQPEHMISLSNETSHYSIVKLKIYTELNLEKIADAENTLFQWEGFPYLGLDGV
jgi:hypothetical protein